jgi:CubicO group peptidase (beta-lactamase class C family)
MTVTALPTARRNGAIPCAHPASLANSRHHATSASGLVHEATAPLLAALADAVAAAAAQGINDTGARETAAALRDARIALNVAIIAAGRALADREVHIQVDPPTAAQGAVPA